MTWLEDAREAMTELGVIEDDWRLEKLRWIVELLLDHLSLSHELKEK